LIGNKLFILLLYNALLGIAYRRESLNHNLFCLLLYLVLIALFGTLDAGLLARSQYSEGPATNHLDTGFSWFPCA